MVETIAPFIGKLFLLALCCYACYLVWAYLCRPILFGSLPNSRWGGPGSWAIVTGGGSGVGRGFAEELARKGFNIIILELNQQAMSDTRQAIQKHSPSAQVITEQVDFSQPPSSWIPRISNLINNKDIAILVNNVGINTEIPIVYTTHNLDHVNKMVQVNCSGMLALTQFIVPIMEKKGRGGIIFMSSSSGYHPTPLMAIYSATKAFIWKFAMCLSVEEAPHNIDVLVLHPFYVKSTMSGFRRTSFMVVSPNEFARKALNWLGRSVTAQPIFSHLLLDWLFYLVPESIGLKVRRDKMVTAAAKLLRRKEREGTAPADNSRIKQ